MKLQFDPHQEYQLEAIRAVTGVFEGEYVGSGKWIGDSTDAGFFVDTGAANVSILSEEKVIENVRAVQERNKVAASEFAGMHFTVEMETGTGKTYVYLRTIFELNAKYGFKKFIIVVPSIAIREGVLKNLEITKEHFRELYDNVPFDHFVYSAKQLGRIRIFATANTLQIMVINIDAFTRDENIINNVEREGGAMVELIKKTNPIVIVDEPQNMETDKRKAAIESLNPLCTLRYSATHKHLYNLLYRLTPVDAYNLGLVKKVEVASIEEENSHNDMFLEIVAVAPGEKDIKVKLRFEYLSDEGIKQKTATVSSTKGIDLFRESNKLEQYKEVDFRGATQDGALFSVGTHEFTLGVGQKTGVIDEAIMKEQIRATVEEHLKKKRALNARGVKVLSLFFIDRVEHYRGNVTTGEKGKFLTWFEEVWSDFRSGSFRDLELPEASLVHRGYFSQDRRGNLLDTSGETQGDEDAYDLIMKEKERLLSFSEPVECIFSHSALKEGWDNPNVFQICVLREMGNMLTKRQTIGRGLRLPVNQDGVRVVDSSMNIVTVVANENYESFASGLQKEMQDAGVEFDRSLVKKKEKRKRARLKEGYMEDEYFCALWEKICHKTRYQVSFETSVLIEKARTYLRENLSVKPPRIRRQLVELVMSKKGVGGTTKTDASRREDVILPMPDILGNIERQTHLSKETIFGIVGGDRFLEQALVNPQEFTDKCADGINFVLKSEMINGIKYERLEGDGYTMMQFQDDELYGYLDQNLARVTKSEKTIYDHVPYDSATVERPFFEELEMREEVKFYLKLPSWFKIETPIGSYNPDWAVVFDGDQRVYFVAETKGANYRDLSLPEQLKIQCGEKHFGVLPGVVYRGRNVRTLNDLSA